MSLEAGAEGRALAAGAFALALLLGGACSSRVVYVPSPIAPAPIATAATSARAPLQVATEPEPAPPPSAELPRPSCELEHLVGPGCERLRGVAASGTGAEPAATQAFDGDACTIWNAGGFAPQSATLDLGTRTAVTRVVLVPEMTPASAMTTEAVELSDDGKTFRRLGELHAVIRSGEPVELPIPGSAKARFVRIVTTESPSWVAWRDILVLRCGGPVARPANAK